MQRAPRNIQCFLSAFSHSKGLANKFVRVCHKPAWKTRVNSLATPVFVERLLCTLGFPGGSAAKESACNVGDPGSIPGLGRSPGEGKGYPLWYSGLESSMDCMVHGVTKRLSLHFTILSFLATLQPHLPFAFLEHVVHAHVSDLCSWLSFCLQCSFL